MSGIDDSENYLSLVAQWAKEFDKRRYTPSSDEMTAMHSQLFFDLINNENKYEYNAIVIS